MNTTDIELNYRGLPWTDVGDSDASRKFGWEDTPDFLATIFAGQHQLMEKYEDIERRNGAVVVSPDMYGVLDDRQVQIRIKDLAYRAVEELSEATNCLKNKPWKNTFVATDREHFLEELSDFLHFVVELFITAGFTPEDLFKIYFLKHAVNQFRQRTNY